MSKDIIIQADHPIMPTIDKIARAFEVEAHQVVINLILRFLIEHRVKDLVWGDAPPWGEWAFPKNSKGELLTGMDLVDVAQPFLRDRYEEIKAWGKAYVENRKNEEGIRMDWPETPCKKCVRNFQGKEGLLIWVYCPHRKAGGLRLWYQGKAIEWRIFSPVTESEFMDILNEFNKTFEQVIELGKENDEDIEKMLQALPESRFAKT